MIKVEAIIDFTLEKFDELKNIQRKSIEQKGKLFEGDTFNCTKEMYKYLTGTNDKGITVVKVIEVEPKIIPIPNAKPEEVEIIPIPNAKVEDIKIMPVKSTKKKKSSKK